MKKDPYRLTKLIHVTKPDQLKKSEVWHGNAAQKEKKRALGVKWLKFL